MPPVRGGVITRKTAPPPATLERQSLAVASRLGDAGRHLPRGSVSIYKYRSMDPEWPIYGSISVHGHASSPAIVQ